jgi:PAS domain S-box-containing protein
MRPATRADDSVDARVLEAQRHVRDVVALSTLPVVWLGANPDRIAESLLAALDSTIEPKIAYIDLAMDEGQFAVKAAHIDQQPHAELPEEVCSRLREWALAHGPDEILTLAHTALGGEVDFLVHPIGHSSECGVLAIGYSREGIQSRFVRTLLSVAANQAFVACTNSSLQRKAQAELLQRRQTEAELRESSEFNRSLIENSLDCIKTLDLEGNIVWMSEVGWRSLGHDGPEALVGQCWTDLWQEADQPAAREALAQAIRGGTGSFLGKLETEGRIQWWHVLISPTSNQEGESRRLLAVSRDVTDRKLTEEATRIQSEQFRSLLDHAPVGIYLVDDAFRVRAINPAAQSIFEAVADPIGRDFSEVIHLLLPKKRAEAVIALFRRTLETGEPFSTSEWSDMLTGNDELQYFEWQLNRIPLPDGGNAVVCYFKDITYLVRTREALAEISADSERQRRLYHAVLSSTTDLVFVFGLDYRFTYANQALLDLWGRSWEDSIGKSLLELGYEPWHAEMHEREIDQVVATKQPIRGEVPFTGTNGRRIYDYIFVPVIGEDGQVEAVAGSTRDVTERKEAEEALKASEDFLRTSLDASAGGFYGIDRDGATTVCNAAFLNMLGFERMEDVLGLKLHDLIHHTRADGSHYPKEECPIYLAAQTGKPAHVVDELFFRLDGSSFPVEYWTLPIVREGEVRGAVTTFIDITDRKKAEEELRASTERMRFMAESMPQKIFTAKPDGSVDYFNPQWMEFTGLKLDEIKDWGWTQFIHPDDLDENIRVWKIAVESGNPFNFEHRFRRHDGEFRWHLSRAQAMRDEHGEVVMWVGSNTDIHEQKEQEQELERRVQERTAQLLAANEQLQGFTYSVAHDLRQQIRGININASIVLADAPELEGEIKETLERLANSASQLGALVDDLLAYTKLEKQQPKATAVDLTTLAEEVFVYVREHQPQYHKVKLQVEPGLVAYGDPLMLRIVLENLVDNACKYSISKESPELMVGRKDGAFYVQDNGVGFEQKYAQKVFQPFERLHSEAGVEGTGIGLANVRRIVEKHGGKVWAEGKPGSGAVFYFTLPKKPS